MSQEPNAEPPANRRTYQVLGEAESLGNQLKRATVKGREIISDESAGFGGAESAPGAMDYFVAAVMF